MLTLPLWLAIYLSIGILCVLWCGKDITRTARPLLAGATGPGLWIACAYLVLTFVLLWPYVAARVVWAMACAAVKVLRDHR